jgi:hypothetical protein
MLAKQPDEVHKHLLQSLLQITYFDRRFLLYAMLASHHDLWNRRTQDPEQFLEDRE